MAYIQRNIPPPNKILNFSMQNFIGGLNNKSMQIENNQMSDVRNMRFADDTSVENRFGQKLYDEITLPSTVSYIDEFKPYNADNQLVRATNTKLYMDAVNVATITGEPCGTNFMGKYFLADGSDLFVYGKFAQVTTTYENVIGTPVNDYVFMKVVTPSLAAVRLDSTHVRGVLNIDYTNSQVWYVPCDNEFSDTYSGANVLPENPKLIVSHKGRVYISGDIGDNDNVFISDVSNPYYFPVSLPIQVPPNSDEVVALKVFDDAIIIGRKHDLHAIHGNTNRTDMGVDVFQLRKINTHTGMVNNKSQSLAHNYLFYLGCDGVVYALLSSQYDETKIATTILSKQIDIFRPSLNITIEELTNACAVFYKDEFYISFDELVLIYNYRYQAWTVYDKIYARSYYVKDYVLMWGKEDGTCAVFDEVTFKDFSVPYQSYFYTKWFDMDMANNFKQFREFFVLAHAFNDYYSDIIITFDIDYETISDRYIVKNKLSIWGESVWGDRFISRNISESIPFMIGRRGRNIRFRVTSNYNKHSEVATYSDLSDVFAKKNGMLVYVVDEGNYYLYFDYSWILLSSDELNQKMRIYQINGDYEIRGKR